MSRILIITPGSPCRNPRPLKEAETLGRAGHDVVLLSVSESPALDAMERELLKGASFRHESAGSPGSAIVRTYRRVRQRIARQITAAGFPSLHALGHAGDLRQRAIDFPADLTIVHNEIPFWIGCDLLDHGRRVAADFEDWHSEDLLPEARRSRPLDLLRDLERRLLRECVHTTTTSAALSRALALRYGAPAPHVLTNSFPLQPAPQPHSSQSPAFFWFSQTLGPGRGLESFCDAWIQTKQPSRLVLVGEPAENFDHQLRARLPAEFQKRIAFLPLVPPDKLPSLIAQHDIGLALEQSWIVNRDLTITNKILQYFNAGLAVAATPTAGQREVLANAPGAGWLIDFTAPPATAAAALDQFLSDSAALTTARREARAAAEKIYCWEREGPRLVALVANALSVPPR